MTDPYILLQVYFKMFNLSRVGGKVLPSLVSAETIAFVGDDWLIQTII